MKISDIKARLKAIVETSELLTDRPILIEDKGNLVNQVETVLQTQSLAVVIALASGQAKDGSRQRPRAAWTETFEVVIHRGLLDGEDVPSTDDVLDDLRSRLQGELVTADQAGDGTFTCSRHDLRDGGDGTYARVLNVSIDHPIAPPTANP